MKYIIIISLLFSIDSFSACITPLVRTDVGFQNVLTSAKYNADVNQAYNQLNNLPGDCIVDGSITSSKIADGTISSSKIANGAITSAKVASGAIPEAGRLLRISSFSSSGTWTKQSDVGSVLIHVIAGGGASSHASANNGGSSSFGAHCSASGGLKPSGNSGGLGGAGSGGDINLSGSSGENFSTNNGRYSGGGSFYGSVGQGGQGIGVAGGGGGGYCAKLIAHGNLGATETVTVGLGGSHPSGGVSVGGNGIVIIYEYSK